MEEVKKCSHQAISYQIFFVSCLISSRLKALKIIEWYNMDRPAISYQSLHQKFVMNNTKSVNTHVYVLLDSRNKRGKLPERHSLF